LFYFLNPFYLLIFALLEQAEESSAEEQLSKEYSNREKWLTGKILFASPYFPFVSYMP